MYHFVYIMYTLCIIMYHWRLMNIKVTCQILALRIIIIIIIIISPTTWLKTHPLPPGLRPPEPGGEAGKRCRCKSQHVSLGPLSEPAMRFVSCQDPRCPTQRLSLTSPRSDRSFRRRPRPACLHPGTGSATPQRNQNRAEVKTGRPRTHSLGGPVRPVWCGLWRLYWRRWGLLREAVR